MSTSDSIRVVRIRAPGRLAWPVAAVLAGAAAGCLPGGTPQPAPAPPGAAGAAAESAPAASATTPATADASRPWVVLSGFSITGDALNRTAQVSYRFVQGAPEPGRTYYWFVEQARGRSGFVSYFDDPVQLDPRGGTLTMQLGQGPGAGEVYTFIAAGPRSATYSEPEPEHISGDLYEGQSESAAAPLAPGEEPPPPELGQTVVFSNPRREPGAGGDQVAVDYQLDKLPEVSEFYLTFFGAEGGSVQVDVSDVLRAAPNSGTLRRPVADLSELAAPYEVQLDAQPFGPNAGTPFGAIRISNTVKVE